ncbi:Probable RNA-directed DNA polymerase from transposon BS [Eumeta japonica]|uniref:Probable RNA-directed DNA polymerase from transposon BS n=1 Tax=Eumeta variegata TaxID=151549 RepID=A0A4C1YR11_EUMVA|nr:Probable RNA-directed DNA polymerase from transposon BS [Eumeta japonica]
MGCMLHVTACPIKASNNETPPKNDLPLISLSKVQTLNKSLKTRKAPGLNDISNKVTKCFSLPLLGLLLATFNVCLKNCYPSSPIWKETEVIGIHKPGKLRNLLACYRPISLLSGLGKLFENILKTRFSNHPLRKSLIIDEQFGFQPAHSCPQQALHLVEYITEDFKFKQKTSRSRTTTSSYSHYTQLPQ